MPSEPLSMYKQDLKVGMMGGTKQMITMKEWDVLL